MKKTNWGVEVWWNDMMMDVKHHSIMVALFIFGQSSLTLLISYFWYGRLWTSWGRYVASGLRDGDIEYKFALEVLSALLSKSIYIFFVSGLVWLLYPVALKKFKNKGDDLLADKWISGAKLITPAELNEAIRKDGEKIRIHIGEINYPAAAETEHCLVIGRPGQGKTLILSDVIGGVKI